MPTQKIMVIRHAEKPLHHGDGGVDSAGHPDPESLTPRGWERAGALVQFFAPIEGEPRQPVARPDHLFAANADAATNDDSKRPRQTIEPLAAYLGAAAPIDDSMGKDDLQSLVDKATASDGTVLIAWEHKRISPMARLLVPADGAIPDWPDDRFDMVWVFDRAGPTWQLTQVPQLLLAGDQSATF